MMLHDQHLHRKAPPTPASVFVVPPGRQKRLELWRNFPIELTPRCELTVLAI